ncbi:hypothetical protein ANCCAN_15194 [Ancylostoma caninum]|uniref:Uncharacterized protein n=1 Tax=Ancylostoma caninum TaxID=29170 RepID=A0A368G374_ANCCA|nr:hypothetical protein ANCCAN_15194 [Ancylostoma caninum]
MAQRQPEVTPVQNGFPHSESLKKTELNNNHLPAKKAVGSPTSNLSKAKSEGNLSEEVENSPPTNFDDMPIKPAKGGQYFDGAFFLTHSLILFSSEAKFLIWLSLSILLPVPAPV